MHLKALQWLVYQLDSCLRSWYALLNAPMCAQVIIALQERSLGMARPHIPYRNSKMTQARVDAGLTLTPVVHQLTSARNYTDSNAICSMTVPWGHTVMAVYGVVRTSAGAARQSGRQLPHHHGCQCQRRSGAAGREHQHLQVK